MFSGIEVLLIAVSGECLTIECSPGSRGPHGQPPPAASVLKWVGLFEKAGACRAFRTKTGMDRFAAGKVLRGSALIVAMASSVM